VLAEFFTTELEKPLEILDKMGVKGIRSF